MPNKGYKIFSDEESIKIEDYSGNKKKYYCGKQFLEINEKNGDKFIICLIDANECVIGLMINMAYEILWEHESYVPRKHDAGGQSQRRFEKNRELALCDWFKNVNTQLMEIRKEYPNEKILLGINKCNEAMFYKSIHRTIQDAIIATDSVSYIHPNSFFELMEKCSEKIKHTETAKNKKIVEDYAKLLAKESPTADYGICSLNQQKNILILYTDKATEEELNQINQIQCEKKIMSGFYLIDNLRVCVINKY